MRLVKSRGQEWSRYVLESVGEDLARNESSFGMDGSSGSDGNPNSKPFCWMPSGDDGVAFSLVVVVCC